jgi:hypothetical protein
MIKNILVITGWLTTVSMVVYGLSEFAKTYPNWGGSVGVIICFYSAYLLTRNND